jgi:DNA-binding transcriptional MerR regulator
MPKRKEPEKLYYSISEVSEMTSLEAYVLRYWEKEFPQLKPKKNRGGNRMYTKDDIEIINRINHLRTVEKLTIPGARKRLAARKPTVEKATMLNTAKAKTLISQIRKDVQDLLDNLS